MEKDLEKIPHFSLLAAAFVTYLSSAPEDIRRRAMDQVQLLRKFSTKLL
jgi:hypothetical protein